MLTCSCGLDPCPHSKGVGLGLSEGKSGIWIIATDLEGVKHPLIYLSLPDAQLFVMEIQRGLDDLSWRDQALKKLNKE